MHGFEVHERARVVEDRLQFGVPGLCEVALRLQDEEGRLHPSGELLLLGLQFLLLQFPRGPRRFDALLVGRDLAGRVTHLRHHAQFGCPKLRSRLVHLQLRRREVRLGAAVADRVVHLHGEAPGRKVPANQRSEDRPVADHRGPDQRAVPIVVVARAAFRGHRVLRLEVHVGQRLVAQVSQRQVVLFQGLSLPDQVRAGVERLPDRRIDIHRLRLEGRRVGQIELHGPEVRRLGVHDERPELIFGLRHGGLRADDGFLARGDFRLRLDDVDRRHRPDPDARLVVLQRLARQIERLLLHFERRNVVGEVPVRVLDAADRRQHGLAQLHVRDLAILRADQQLPARPIDLEIPQERLRVGRAELRPEHRVGQVEGVVALQPLAAPRDLVVRSPAQLLVRAEAPLHLLSAQRGAGRRVDVVVRRRGFAVQEPGGEVGRPDGLRDRDVQIAQSRVDAFDLQIQVLLERHLHGVVHRQLPDDGAAGRLVRLLAACPASGHILAESGHRQHQQRDQTQHDSRASCDLFKHCSSPVPSPVQRQYHGTEKNANPRGPPRAEPNLQRAGRGPQRGQPAWGTGNTGMRAALRRKNTPRPCGIDEWRTSTVLRCR